MIDRIIIDNFATIEHISFDLGSGLNIITGETGAGKSVLITAISTVLGDRADTSMVRTGSDRSLIQLAGDKNGESVIITREILSSGKSISKLNGEMIVLDGKVYRADGEGNVEEVPDEETIPFASMTFFDEDDKAELTDVKSINDLVSKLDKKYTEDSDSRNYFQVVAVGRLHRTVLRSKTDAMRSERTEL